MSTNPWNGGYYETTGRLTSQAPPQHNRVDIGMSMGGHYSSFSMRQRSVVRLCMFLILLGIGFGVRIGMWVQSGGIGRVARAVGPPVLIVVGAFLTLGLIVVSIGMAGFSTLSKYHRSKSDLLVAKSSASAKKGG